MAKDTDTPTFNMDVVTGKEAASILKESRARGTRASKYTPIYESVGELKSDKFLILRGVDKSAKLGIYQGVKRNFGDEVKMASARERDAEQESYTIVIGKSDDYKSMRELARQA